MRRRMRRLSFYRDSFFIEVYSPHIVFLPRDCLIFLCLVSHTLNVHAGTENIYITQYRCFRTCRSLAQVSSLCVTSLAKSRSRYVQVIVVTFSGHIFDLKGVPVSSDLGAVWSAAFIVRTGGDSPIKGTFVYLNVPISMHKSDRARRFIALPNVVKRPPRDTHGEAGPFCS